MNYKNEFNLPDEITDAIAKIVSERENTEYVCKIVKCVIPEHKDSVLVYNHSYYGGPSISGASLKALTETYGRKVEKTIPEQELPYLIIMEKNAYEVFNELTFKDLKGIENSLVQLSALHVGYNGTINPEIFNEKFEYLQIFFSYLNEWREKTGRVLIEENIINEGLIKTIGSKKKKY